MLRSLFNLFEHQFTKFAEEPEAKHTLELAGAALLLEVGRADDNVSVEERAAIRKAIENAFHLTHEEIDDIVAAAEEAVDTSISLYDFTAIVNERFTREQRVELVEMLWAVAYADRSIDHYEEYYVRKIADLLHVSHSDYIRTKHRAMAR